MAHPKPSRRAEKLAKVKQGAGVFIYDGSWKDSESIPTPMITGKNEPVFDSSGMPVFDSSGRQMFEASGKIKRGANGQPVLGGKPKMVFSQMPIVKIMGIEFKEGEEVGVEDPILAVKLRCLNGFKEVELKSTKNVVVPKEEQQIISNEIEQPKKRGRKKKEDDNGVQG